MVGVVSAVVVTVGVLGPRSTVVHDALIRFTPDLAVLFAVGVLAAGIVTAGDRSRSRPWAAFAAAAAAPVIVLILAEGPTWTIDNLFWVDLAWAPAIGCFLAAVGTSRPRLIVRILDTRPLHSLGSFSYSLYLTHAPIVIAVSYGLVLGRVAPGAPTFLVLVAVLLPTTVCFARLFAAVFELPFQRHRGWAPMVEAVSGRGFSRRSPSEGRLRRVADEGRRPVEEVAEPGGALRGRPPGAVRVVALDRFPVLHDRDVRGILDVHEHLDAEAARECAGVTEDRPDDGESVGGTVVAKMEIE
jgi:peptidoglycan/LPS O-acetylase OafA/YrhL